MNSEIQEICLIGQLAEQALNKIDLPNSDKNINKICRKYDQVSRMLVGTCIYNEPAFLFHVVSRLAMNRPSYILM